MMSAYTARGNGKYSGSQLRGGRGAYRGATRRKIAKQEPEWPSGRLIKAVSVSGLPNVETSPKIESCEYLASYNWLDHPEFPTILVPGLYSLLGQDRHEIDGVV